MALRLDIWAFVSGNGRLGPGRSGHRERSEFRQAASRLHQQQTWEPGVEERVDDNRMEPQQIPISQA